MFFPGLHGLPRDSLLFRLWFDSSKANCCQSRLAAGADLSSFGNLDEGQELGHLHKRFFFSAAAIFV